MNVMTDKACPQCGGEVETVPGSRFVCCWECSRAFDAEVAVAPFDGRPFNERAERHDEESQNDE